MSTKKDKILIWIGSEFTHFLLAHTLQKNYDADYYAIIDITNKPKEFFENQQIVKFKKIWFLHDEVNSFKNFKIDYDYLKTFESKYRINLWRLLINERIFYRFYNFHKFSSDEILLIEQGMCRFFEKILDEIKPDFFITKVPSFHHLELFKDMCKKQNVNVLMLNYAKLSSKMYISQDTDALDYVTSLDQGKSKGRNFVEMRNYLKKNSPTIQLKEFHQKDSEKKIAIQLVTLIKYLFSNNTTVKTHYNYYGRTKSKVLFDLFNRMISKKIRANFMKKELLKEIKLDTPYVYFPLSVDLERYILIDSPFHTNQIEIIRHIVKSLPVGFQLFVKENPSMVTRDWRTISEYKEIMGIPNVKLFHPTVSNEKLLENAKLVISIAGSSALEAAFYEKPSIVFGKVFYNLLPSVKKVDRIEDLHNSINDALNHKVNPEDLDKFISILDTQLFDFNMVEFSRKFSDEIYYNASNVDVEINEEDIKNFINKNYNELDLLASEHLKKIDQHKKQ